MNSKSGSFLGKLAGKKAFTSPFADHKSYETRDGLADDDTSVLNGGLSNTAARAAYFDRMANEERIRIELSTYQAMALNGSLSEYWLMLEPSEGFQRMVSMIRKKARKRKASSKTRHVVEKPAKPPQKPEQPEKPKIEQSFLSTIKKKKKPMTHAQMFLQQMRSSDDESTDPDTNDPRFPGRFSKRTPQKKANTTHRAPFHKPPPRKPPKSKATRASSSVQEPEIESSSDTAEEDAGSEVEYQPTKKSAKRAATLARAAAQQKSKQQQQQLQQQAKSQQAKQKQSKQDHQVQRKPKPQAQPEENAQIIEEILKAKEMEEQSEQANPKEEPKIEKEAQPEAKQELLQFPITLERPDEAPEDQQQPSRTRPPPRKAAIQSKTQKAQSVDPPTSRQLRKKGTTPAKQKQQREGGRGKKTLAIEKHQESFKCRSSQAGQCEELIMQTLESKSFQLVQTQEIIEQMNLLKKTLDTSQVSEVAHFARQSRLVLANILAKFANDDFSYGHFLDVIYKFRLLVKEVNPKLPFKEPEYTQFFGNVEEGKQFNFVAKTMLNAYTSILTPTVKKTPETIVYFFHKCASPKSQTRLLKNINQLARNLKLEPPAVTVEGLASLEETDIEKLFLQIFMLDMFEIPPDNFLRLLIAMAQKYTTSVLMRVHEYHRLQINPQYQELLAQQIKMLLKTESNFHIIVERFFKQYYFGMKRVVKVQRTKSLGTQESYSTQSSIDDQPFFEKITGEYMSTLNEYYEPWMKKVTEEKYVPPLTDINPISLNPTQLPMSNLVCDGKPSFLAKANELIYRMNPPKVPSGVEYFGVDNSTPLPNNKLMIVSNKYISILANRHTDYKIKFKCPKAEDILKLDPSQKERISKLPQDKQFEFMEMLKMLKNKEKLQREKAKAEELRLQREQKNQESKGQPQEQQQPLNQTLPKEPESPQPKQLQSTSQLQQPQQMQQTQQSLLQSQAKPSLQPQPPQVQAPPDQNLQQQAYPEPCSELPMQDLSLPDCNESGPNLSNRKSSMAVDTTGQGERKQALGQPSGSEVPEIPELSQSPEVPDTSSVPQITPQPTTAPVDVPMTNDYPAALQPEVPSEIETFLQAQ